MSPSSRVEVDEFLALVVTITTLQQIEKLTTNQPERCVGYLWELANVEIVTATTLSVRDAVDAFIVRTSHEFEAAGARSGCRNL